jgi:hypothetical protein
VATNRTSEDDNLFDSEWEDDYDNELEPSNDNSGDDGEFDYDSLSASEKKRYDKMRKSIEDSLVDELSKGDTNSPVYKGMQRVVSQKDRELQQYRQALAGVIQQVQAQEEKGGDVDFLKEIVKDMLDDDSKRVFDEKFERFTEKRKGTKTEQMLAALLQQQQGQQQQYPMYGQEQEDPQIAQYRKEATKRLQAFAKKMGVDPEKDGLDFGDENDALLVRMDKLAASIERVSKEKDEQEIQGVRRRGTQPNTRTRGEPAVKDVGDDSVSNILERGSMALLQKMRSK